MDSFAGNNSGADMVTGTLANIQSTDVVSGGTSLGDTLTVTSAGALNFVVAGTNNAQGVSGFEKLVLADGANTVTLRTNIERTAAVDGNWSTITGGTGYDTVVLTAVTGTAAGAATKTPALVTNTNAINLTTVTGIEQFNATATGGAGGTAAGLGGAANEQITFSGAGVSGTIVNATATGGAAGTKSVGGAASVTVSLADFVNSLTVIGNTTNGAVAGTVAGGVASVVINGGTTVDTITTAAAGNFVFNQVETVNGGAAGGTFTINAGTNTAGSTFNSAANAGAQTITGTAFADVINLSATNGADTVVVTGSLVNNIDKVNNFVVANDSFKVGAVLNNQNFSTQTVTTSTDLAGLAGALSNAVNAAKAVNVNNYDTRGDAVLVSITTGAAAGDYLVIQNTAVGAVGTGLNFTAATDIVVQLTGTVGSITVADIIA